MELPSQIPDLKELGALVATVPLFVFGARQLQGLVRTVLGAALILTVLLVVAVSTGITPAPDWYPL
jgi:hypothetical protein